MADPRFFCRAGPFRLGDLAGLCAAELAANADPDMAVVDVAPLSSAGPGEVSFLDNRKFLPALEQTAAGACILHPDMAGRAPAGTNLLLSRTPYKSYALAAQAFYPEPAFEPGVADGAVVDPTATVGEGTCVGSGAVIGARAEIGKACRIGPNAVIGEGAIIGDGTVIGPNATLSHCIVGSGVVIFPGVRIGQPGFGFAIDPAGHVKVPQLGRVIVEDGVEIGANATIDRGAATDTVIGAGTMIDNLVHIGHNVRLGKGCVLAGQVGISGSTELGDLVVMGGQSGLAGHLNIGSGAQIAAQSGVLRNVAPGERIMGTPAKPLRRFFREVATLERVAAKKDAHERDEGTS